MKTIKNIIFDFGGVLYDIDLNRTIEAFKSIGIDLSCTKWDNDHVFIQTELGLILPNEFPAEVNRFFKTHLKDEDIISAFSSVLKGLSTLAISNLKKLEPHFNLYLLSNTSMIHYSRFSNEINENPLTKSFYNFFKKEYYSFKIHLRKPDSAIYNFVLKDAGIFPEETVFVDDDLKNVEGAMKCGLNALHFKGKESWKELFKLCDLRLS